MVIDRPKPIAHDLRRGDVQAASAGPRAPPGSRTHFSFRFAIAKNLLLRLDQSTDPFPAAPGGGLLTLSSVEGWILRLSSRQTTATCCRGSV